MPRTITQGGRANRTGGGLEHFIESQLQHLGYSRLPNGTLPTDPRTYARHVPYTNLYGGQSRSEFVLCDIHGEAIRIEAKWQQAAGSVDEKFPYMFLSLLQVPELHIIIVQDGGGARPDAARWLREEAKKQTAKRIDVFNMQEFMLWVNRHHA